MAGAPRLLRDRAEVEQLHRGRGGDGFGRLLGDDPQLGLGLGKGGEDVEPPLDPGALVEDAAQLVGRPEVAVEGRVRQAGAHGQGRVRQAGAHAGSESRATSRRPRRTSSSEAPQGTTTQLPSRTMSSSRRQHFVRVGRSVGVAPASSLGHMSTLRGSASP